MSHVNKILGLGYFKSLQIGKTLDISNLFSHTRRIEPDLRNNIGYVVQYYHAKMISHAQAHSPNGVPTASLCWLYWSHVGSSQSCWSLHIRNYIHTYRLFSNRDCWSFPCRQVHQNQLNAWNTEKPRSSNTMRNPKIVEKHVPNGRPCAKMVVYLQSSPMFIEISTTKTIQL